jgi:hypothetical protein
LNQANVRIEGSCHCGNIRYALDWPGDAAEIGVRACDCTFCTKHGGNWISHRDAELVATIQDASHVSKYGFGTATAAFYVCSRCGVVPFVLSSIDGLPYAVVNVNTLDGVDPTSFARTPAHFDGEGSSQRLARRKRNWIRTVKISVAGSPAAAEGC